MKNGQIMQNHAKVCEIMLNYAKLCKKLDLNFKNFGRN